MGGPFSGKSCLAEALRTHFPGIEHVSGEEVARMVNCDEAASASGQSSNVVPASQGNGGKCKGGVPHTTPTKNTVLSCKSDIDCSFAASMRMYKLWNGDNWFPSGGPPAF